MKALVTGATGFVGCAVARNLQRHGFELRLLVRQSSDRRNLEGLTAEIVDGDLTDPERLALAATGCRAVFHVAADYRLWAPDPAPLYAANVDGTRNLLRAAADAGVARVVYTSSVATLGIPKDGAPGAEDTPVTLADMIGHYKRSKYLAEQVALEAAGAGQDVVIVNPSTPIGPRDRKPTPTGRIVIDAAAGRLPAYVDTGLNVVHVDDVAEGHRLAFERGRTGERYVLGGTDLTLAQILAGIAGIAGRKPPRVRLPHGLVLPIAYLAEGVARLTGGRPIATVEEVRMSRKRMFFSSRKAIQELGYRPRPARQALEDAVRWYRDNGYLD
ncbi:MAG: NAD-dependent epimerase/dehydratase family protein [Gammaproteobacteria bacterium]|nr:NAD-dependent epimerase/dehydratase family protein [Gammaproteobacteria bacterium]